MTTSTPLPFLETLGISPEEYRTITLDQIRQYMYILYSKKNNNDDMGLFDRVTVQSQSNTNH